jgi:hypothetical protein
MWGLCSYCQPSVDETTVNDCDLGLKNTLRSNRRPAHVALPIICYPKFFPLPTLRQTPST